jgi:hypothetical protein
MTSRIWKDGGETMMIAVTGELRNSRSGCSVVFPPFIDEPESAMDLPEIRSSTRR